MIQLSNVAPDFDDLVLQLTNVLQTKDAWKDRLTSSTGQTLVEMIAAIGAYSQYSIESAYQESFPESAKNNNSLYAASNFLGVRFNRKLPASVQVSLTSAAPVIIPVNSQFNGAGTYWFNRSPLTLGPTPTVVTLHQGRVVTTQVQGLGTDFQAWVSPEKDFVVSDQDVFVTVNSISVPAIQEGLWTKEGLPGAQHFTLPSGQMILLFGNSIYGTRPSTTDICEITYVVTLGADGANVPTLGKTFSYELDPTIQGVAVTQASGGGNQANPLIYKNVTPALFGSFNSSVTPSQYKKLPLQYPGVIDAQTFAQREINPRALTWMNVIKVCLLTQTPWSAGDFLAFEQWFYENTMYSTRIVREDPVATPITIQATVHCLNLANLGTVQAKVEAALDNLFALRQGSIGRDFYRSDIIDAILEADSNIDFVRLEQPATDIVLSSLNVNTPSATILPSGGTLGPGLYDYAISAVSSLGGETAPANWVTVNISSGTTNRIQLNWEPVSNALQYKIWGRTTPTSLGLLATVPASTLQFIDTGAITPTGSVSVQSTVASYYANLVAKNITVLYSNRDILS